MSKLVGLYVDHQMTSPLAMAQHSAKIKPIAPMLASKGVLLVTTCLRVEVYSTEAALGDIKSTIFSGFTCGRIQGAVPITQRLAEIAAGVHSQILGENYVSDQLEKASELLDPNLPIFQIAQFAIDAGRRARERHGFVAPFNYDQIVRDIITDLFKDGALPDRLYMIGAGMLGRDLIRCGLGEHFRSTAIVTRNPKNLRKRFRTLTDKEVALIRPAEIGPAREPRSIVVIATTDVNDEYAAMLKNALLHLKPRAIVDLSSIPVLSSSAVGKLNYVTMYDEAFLSYVEKNNKQLAARMPIVCSEIEATIGMAQVIIS